jgi:hypothetical protein
MHNRLIFRYHRARVRADLWLLRGCPFGGEPTRCGKASDGVTQEGR